jgi:outer membrane protein OmpA-like peptidoglycan-associated protein
VASWHSGSVSVFKGRYSGPGCRLLRRGALASLVALLSGCSWLWPTPDPEPEPVQYSDAAVPGIAHEQVTILPKENGSIGGVVVWHDGVEVLLDKPYATALVEAPGIVTELTYDAGLAKREFAVVLAALPQRSSHFLVYFEEDADELTPESEAEIDKIFAALNTRTDPEIVLIGHTDAVGTGRYNDKLSEDRAMRVRDALVRLGIADNSIVVEWRGKREPLVATEDGVAEPKNRRVEIEVR